MLHVDVDVLFDVVDERRALARGRDDEPDVG